MVKFELICLKPTMDVIKEVVDKFDFTCDSLRFYAAFQMAGIKCTHGISRKCSQKGTVVLCSESTEWGRADPCCTQLFKFTFNRWVSVIEVRHKSQRQHLRALGEQYYQLCRMLLRDLTTYRQLGSLLTRMIVY